MKKAKTTRILITVLVMLLMLWIATSPKRWRRLTCAVVSKNGKPVISEVFLSNRGNILISVDEKGDKWWYVLLPSDKVVASGGRNNFVVLPWFAYDTKGSYGVDMSSPKFEMNPNLQINAKTVQFNSFYGSHIKLNL